MSQKILEITDEEEGSREELIRCVSLDQAIASKVLQLINSAYYGIKQKVSSLEVAVGLLGDKQIRDIAIICASSGLLRSDIRGYGIPADQFWLHSVTTAFAGRLIAEKFKPDMRETAFAAGLLHDIGKLVINRLIEEPHREIFWPLAGEKVPGYHSREIELFGFDHCTVGFFIARKWEFPEDLTAAISFHHYPDFDVAHRDFVRVICFADTVAHLMVMGMNEPEMISSLAEDETIPFDLSLRDIEEIFSSLKVEIDNSQAFLGVA